ncbi:MULTISPECIES: class I SAM-dependent methyltransferase [Streptomyces]|uniref:class I SAM-dependent methyltransferase n=1 Tax=Streptomyces TaxID=1883 RepID=UPI001907D801|nr:MULTISPECIES: class I SAM-dependent methyltransferase [unclassified Streptomyces]MCU4747313.1 class I SAM-dependent methyltransferase [Streptomyces sp. G-5]QQN77944.1 class I SAM-dependent methyltransferase [Streptomyces sp. XC 2026]
MPFDHNDHYHRWLLRTARRLSGPGPALDVGCGTGAFARKLAAAGYTVEGIDPSPEVIAAARAATVGPNPRFREGDITTAALPRDHYAVITALASLHHVPFETVARLRDALAPGGTLLILGCAPDRTALDHAYGLVSVPLNAAARLACWAHDRATGRRPPPKPPVRDPTVPLPVIRRRAAELLPGARVRRRLFWRHTLVHRRPSEPGAGSPA